MREALVKDMVLVADKVVEVGAVVEKVVATAH